MVLLVLTVDNFWASELPPPGKTFPCGGLGKQQFVGGLLRGPIRPLLRTYFRTLLFCLIN